MRKIAVSMILPGVALGALLLLAAVPGPGPRVPGQPAQTLPPRPTVPTGTLGPPPMPSPTPTPTVAAPARPVVQGGFIALQVEPARQGWWTTIQWQDPAQGPRGTWYDVDGWRGHTDAAGRVLWWVDGPDLGSGPFRWLVYESEAGPLLATSAPFYLPDVRLQTVEVAVGVE